MTRLSILALSLTIGAAALNVSQASASMIGRGGLVSRSPAMSSRSVAPLKLSQINRSSPAAVRSYLTPYQPTTKSMGVYAPWAVQNPYGMHMLGTPAQRAVACGC